jgi:hypothetical protein
MTPTESAPFPQDLDPEERRERLAVIRHEVARRTRAAQAVTVVPLPCRVCGAADPALLVRNASRPSGYDSKCLACHRAQAIARNKARRRARRS